jgi:hypothetical protein
MIKKTFKIAITLIILLTLFACSNDYPSNVIDLDTTTLDETSDTYWSSIFDNYWNYMNINYVFWEEELSKDGAYQSNQEEVDWDELYDSYVGKFNDLTTENIQSQYSAELSSYSGSALLYKTISIRNTLALEYFYEMEKNLIDHHYTLRFKNVYMDSSEIISEDSSKYTKYSISGSANYYNVTIYQPGIIEVASRDSSEFNTNYFNADLNSYLYNEFVTNGGSFNDGDGNSISLDTLSYSYVSNISGTSYNLSTTPFMALSATFDTTAYFYFSSFSISTYYNNNAISMSGNTTINTLINSFWDYVHDSDNDVDKIIIDLRHNTGGNLSDVLYVASQLVKVGDSVEFAQTRSKSGINRLEYSPKLTSKVYGYAQFLAPPYIGTAKAVDVRDDATIIVLTDFYSVSMSEMTTLMLKAIGGNRTVQIGTRTFGAQGALVEDILYSGIEDNDYYYMYTPSTSTFDMDGNSYEGVGLDPDIKIDASTLYNEGLDSPDLILQAALQY